MDEEEEIGALSRITGLPRQILGQDRSISMEWHDIIVAQLIVKDRSNEITTSTYERLQYVGFSEAFIAFLDFDCPDAEMFSVVDIIHIFIKYAVDVVRDKLPELDSNRFPKSVECGTPLNVWGHSSVFSVPFLFSTQSSYQNDALSELNEYLELDELTTYHFHGTSWDFAYDIASDGVQLDLLSNYSTDFGQKCFYVGDNFAVTLNWASLRSAGYAAILCYNFENSQNFEGSTSKIFLDADNEWKEVVFKFHSTGGKSYINEMVNYDLIRGPICALSTDYITNCDDVKPIKHDENVVFQTAVRNTKTAQQMDKYLKGVVFFPCEEK